MAQDRHGNPLIGTKVCSTKSGASNSLSPHVNRMIGNKLGWQGLLAEINAEANKGCGIPRPIADSQIDAFVDHMKNGTNTWRKAYGSPDMTRKLVEEYNEIVREFTDDWHVAEIEIKE